MGNEVRSSGVSSFTPHVVGVVFDLGQESDVLELLKSVHRSALDPDTKNQLRDAVFDYRQSFEQAALTHACELFSSAGMNVTGCDLGTGRARTSPSSRFGSGRRSAFGRPSQGHVRVVTRKPLTVASASVQPVATVPDASLSEVETAISVEETQAPEPTVVKLTVSSTPAPVEPLVPATQHVVPEVPATPVAEPAVVPQPIPVAAVPVSSRPPAERINEIKRIVNEKVGNPVNLIDAHKEIGREYMTALLEAMKKSNGGQAGEVAAAMSRLENAFSAVLSVLEIPQVAEPVPAPTTPDPVTNETVPVAEPVLVATSPDPVINNTAPVAEPEPKLAPLTQASGPVFTPESAIPVQSQVTTEMPAHAAVGALPDPEPTVPTPQPQVISAPLAAAPEVPVTPFNPVRPLTPPPAPVQPVVQTSVAPAEIAAATPIGKVVSVAKAKQVEELMHKQFVEASERDAAAKRSAEEKMDPIMVSDVTTGLHQLLSEWTLFKSSGLFGTGPSGVDHPLYKKLSPLPMQAVIAGRFEGSTAQIRQSISDYMNGWRYEEGVVFDYGESFEHYLRRVIRHIIDKKRKTQTSAK